MTRRLLALLVVVSALACASAAGAATLTPSAFGPTGPPGAVSNPHGVAVGDDGVVFAADTGNNRVDVLRPDGSYVTAWGATDPLGSPIAGSGPGQFSGPQAAAFDSMHGTVWVADTGNNRIQQLGTDGTPLTTDGGPAAGLTPGAFNQPRGIATDVAGDVFVADTANKRIQRRDAATGAWSVLALDRTLSGPAGIAVAADGTVYVGDQARVLRFTPASGSAKATATLLETVPADAGGALKLADGLAVDGSQLYVTDADPSTSRLLRYDIGASAPWTRIGAAGSAVAAFNQPEGVAFGQAADRIYVADSANDRLQRLLDPAGPPLRTVSASLTGAGSGTLTSDPFGVGCPGWCAAGFPAGTRVRLVAAPATGSAFEGWSGACAGTGACVFTLRDARRASASFSLLPGATAKPRAAGSADLTPPRITRVSVLRRAFRAPRTAAAGGRQGGTLRLTLSERALLRVDLVRYAPGRRAGKRCLAPLPKPKAKAKKKARTVRTCTRRLALVLARSIPVMRGANRVAITGRFRGRALAPGRYTVTLTATDLAGNRGLPARTTFTILR